MSQIVEGKVISQKILDSLIPRIERLKEQKINPALAVVIVGDDKPSHTYVKKKGEAAKRIGLTFFKFDFSASVTKESLIEELLRIQAKHDLSGMILQLPIPEDLYPYTREIVNNIDIGIDVDCLSHLALGRVMMNQSPLIPPTPGAVMEVIKHYNVDLKNKEICLIGRGDLVGKPLASMLLHHPITLTVCGRSTQDLKKHTQHADIIITGVGKKDLVTGDMVKDGCIVIDTGVCFEDGKMYGDIQFDSVKEKASLITPTPGGTGPITVAKLLENTVIAAEQKLSFRPE